MKVQSALDELDRRDQAALREFCQCWERSGGRRYCRATVNKPNDHEHKEQSAKLPNSAD